MAFLSSQTISLSGMYFTPVAADAGGDSFYPSDKTFFSVTNGGGASVTVVVDDPNSAGPLEATSFDPDVTVIVPPGETLMVGPFHLSRFGDTDGFVQVTYSDVTSVTVVPLELSDVAI